jgi:hypothetical protein
MGLLGKAISRKDLDSTDTPLGDIQAVIADFYNKNPVFHCIVLQAGGDGKAFSDIAGLMAGHDAVCADLPDGNCLVLLPGGLDMELFSHRLSNSTGLAVLSQVNAISPSLAFEILSPYL